MAAKFQMAIRVDQEIVDDLERIAKALSSRVAGVEIQRSEAMRQALMRGIPVLEAELGLKPRRGKR